MLTSVLTEQMEGSFSLDNTDKSQHFVLRLCAPTPNNKLFRQVRPFTGTVTLSGVENPLACDGILELAPTGPAYEVRFNHPTAGKLILSGKKTYRTTQIVDSMTRCPLKVFANNGSQPVGTGEMRYTHPLWHFPLESFKMLAPELVKSTQNAFSTHPYQGTQYQHKQGEGHYESWFIRANHPELPQALWIRYTQFIPAQSNKERENGELWAIWFDETDGEPISGYQAFPLGSCNFSKDAVNIQIAGNHLTDENLTGSISDQATQFEWDLAIDRKGGPLLLLPEDMYPKGFPKAKSLVLDTHCQFSGTLKLNGKTLKLDKWRGSLNHNWGKQHTDQYAWGQVAGFDGHSDVFLECATAKVKIGPVLSPAFSPVVLKIGHETLRFNQLTTCLRNKGTYTYNAHSTSKIHNTDSKNDRNEWRIQAKNHRANVSIEFSAPASQFASLDYRNPPGGLRRCLNSKIATCKVILDDTEMGHKEFESSHSAAFEILTDV